MINKKQLATWIVTGVLVAGVGAALAEDGPVGGDPTVTDTTVTTVDESTTTTTVDESTTTTTVDESPTTTVADDEVVDGETVEGDDEGHGNAVAAHNHDCDEAWGNHGAWVAANAKAMKTGDEVSCDGPEAATTDDTADDDADTTDATVEDETTETTVAAATTSSTGHGHGKGGGKGHGGKGK